MKIISDEKGYVYEILKPLFHEGKQLQPGDRVNLLNEIGVALTFAGKVKPILPPIAAYKALRSFPFTLKNKKIEIKVRDILEVKAEDALYLLIKRWIFPLDKSVWRPFKLQEKKRHYQFQELFAGTPPRGIMVEVPRAFKRKPFITNWQKDE